LDDFRLFFSSNCRFAGRSFVIFAYLNVKIGKSAPLERAKPANREN